MRASIQNIELSPEITLSECHPDSECRKVNWWLYDTRAGYNLAMRAATREAALVEAIDYWAERCLLKETELRVLSEKVAAFVGSVSEEE